MARSQRGGLGWLVLGVAIGAVAAVVVERRRRATRPDPLHGVVRQRPATSSSLAGRAARLARQSLRAEPRLAELGIRVVPLASGAVELHGWVGSRALRALALRTVGATPTIERVVNHLLVRGEDDAPPPAGASDAEQSA